MRVSRLQPPSWMHPRKQNAPLSGEFSKGVVMRITKLSALAVVAMSLISMATLASPINRKFHPVVNDDPQNAHLNVQTPGADINQKITINEEPGPDGQVIPAGDTKVASCVGKDANGDIDLSGGGSCSSSTTSASIAERASITQPVIAQTSSPSHTSRTVRVPSLASASVAPAGDTNASRAAPSFSRHAVEAARAAAPLPAHRTETARATALPGKQAVPAGQAKVAPNEFVRMWLLATGLTAAVMVVFGLVLLFRMGMGELLRMRRDDEAGEERAARDARTAVSAAVQDPLPSQ